VLETVAPLAQQLSEDHSLQHFVFLGSGPQYGLAAEAMLKMKEMSLSVSEAFHFLEFRHGPKSVVDCSTLVVGLLSDTARDYELAVVRCAPPQDKPTIAEQNTCRAFLREEMGLLPHTQAVLAFGQTAFDNYLRAVSERAGRKLRFPFRHGGRYELGHGLPVLFVSYHPSPRNTNTGRLTSDALDAVLVEVRQWLTGSDEVAKGVSWPLMPKSGP